MTTTDPTHSLRDWIPDDDLTQWMQNVVGEPLTDLRVASLVSKDSASGATLYRVAAESLIGEQHFMLKIAAPESDWISRATKDVFIREAALFEAGLHRHLPAKLSWPMIAARQVQSSAWILLMQDITAMPNARLVPPGDETVLVPEVITHLTNLAALHQTFSGRVELLPNVDFCSVSDWLTMLGSATIERERGQSDPVTPHLERGWDTFYRRASPKIGNQVRALLVDPAMLVEVLSEGAPTLLHGDFKFGNLGVVDGPTSKTIAIDWSQAIWGPPHLDLAWFLAVNSARLPLQKDDIISIFDETLHQTTTDDGGKMLHAALLGGGVLRLGWAKALGAVSDDPATARREGTELDWWLAKAERALWHLGLT